MEVRCRQCGGAIHLDENMLFVHCDYCTSTFYLEDDGGGRHLFSLPHVPKRSLAKILRGEFHKMGVSDDPKVTKLALHYIPFWKYEQDRQKFMAPAYVTHIGEFYQLALPGLDFKYFDDDKMTDGILVHSRLEPEEAYQRSLYLNQNPRLKVESAYLYHLPFYRVEYLIDSKTGSAWIEAGQGKVIQHSPPPMLKIKSPVREFFWIIPMFFIFVIEGLVFGGFFRIFLFAATGLAIYWFWLPKLENF
ncbi:MAG: hypothetical protein B6244_02715 [Candidatus Cloacimonetes bacterium 4572_55]|nr:MAG: hypothetical protein B6244_02715 [Candidatus Cloacimonetes bacterium 4572_55]